MDCSRCASAGGASQMWAFASPAWHEFIKQLLLRLPHGARRLAKHNLSFVFLALEARLKFEKVNGGGWEYGQLDERVYTQRIHEGATNAVLVPPALATVHLSKLTSPPPLSLSLSLPLRPRPGPGPLASRCGCRCCDWRDWDLMLQLSGRRHLAVSYIPFAYISSHEHRGARCELVAPPYWGEIGPDAIYRREGGHGGSSRCSYCLPGGGVCLQQGTASLGSYLATHMGHLSLSLPLRPRPGPGRASQPLHIYPLCAAQPSTRRCRLGCWTSMHAPPHGQNSCAFAQKTLEAGFLHAQKGDATLDIRRGISQEKGCFRNGVLSRLQMLHSPVSSRRLGPAHKGGHGW